MIRAHHEKRWRKLREKNNGYISTEKKNERETQDKMERLHTSGYEKEGRGYQHDRQ